MQCRARCHFGQFARGWRMNMFFSKENGLNLEYFQERLHNGSSRCGMQQCEFKVKHSILVPFLCSLHSVFVCHKQVLKKLIEFGLVQMRAVWFWHVWGKPGIPAIVKHQQSKNRLRICHDLSVLSWVCSTHPIPQSCNETYNDNQASVKRSNQFNIMA